MQVDVEGKLVDATDAHVSVFDGGFQHGDSVFTTLLCHRGHPYRLEAHLDRLRLACEQLFFMREVRLSHWQERIAALVAANSAEEIDARLRLQISRGGDAEFDPLVAHTSVLKSLSFITLRPLAKSVAAGAALPLRLRSLPAEFQRGNFPSIKTANALTSVVALRIARDAECDEVVITNVENQVLEGATSNIFVSADGRLLTPPPSDGVLAGITRARVLELASNLGVEASSAWFTLDQLPHMDEVFLTNSVSGIRAVGRIDDAVIGDGQRGPLTARLQEALAEDLCLERSRYES